MTKIWPVSAAERARGGWGVMLDDIVAGLIAGVIVSGLHYWKVL
jgi:phosphatidylglycerophosphatase A